MSKLQLTMAVSHYDHTVDIVLGKVKIEGDQVIEFPRLPELKPV